MRFVKQRVKSYLARKGYLTLKLDDLTQLANAFGSDKGCKYSAHFYTRIYNRLFRDIKDQPLTILEIGLHRTESDRRRLFGATEGRTLAAATSAPSLEMWRAFFPNARLYGFDIDDFSEVDIPGCTIIRGDVSSRQDLDRLLATIGQSVDIIIDDASHASHHQQIALGVLFPQVRSRGFYIIEDLHWQDRQLERPNTPKTIDLLRKLQVGASFDSPFLSKEESNFVAENFDSLDMFDSMTFELCSDAGLLPRDSNGCDALAVIRKR